MPGRVNFEASNHSNLADLARASIAAGYAMAAETPHDPPREVMQPTTRGPWVHLDAYFARCLAWFASHPLASGARQ
jgi:hypothetical protein